MTFRTYSNYLNQIESELRSSGIGYEIKQTSRLPADPWGSIAGIILEEEINEVNLWVELYLI